jgi:hypothetical protein
MLFRSAAWTRCQLSGAINAVALPHRWSQKLLLTYIMRAFAGHGDEHMERGPQPLLPA